ncbi:unnamed protein product [Amoebophrya sp. A25]|nr:unnamed protein product [Amoebophrya sp. A25]|eukprot:GSA25T00021534001.1
MWRNFAGRFVGDKDVVRVEEFVSAFPTATPGSATLNGTTTGGAGGSSIAAPASSRPPPNVRLADAAQAVSVSLSEARNRNKFRGVTNKRAPQHHQGQGVAASTSAVNAGGAAPTTPREHESSVRNFQAQEYKRKNSEFRRKQVQVEAQKERQKRQQAQEYEEKREKRRQSRVDAAEAKAREKQQAAPGENGGRGKHAGHAGGVDTKLTAIQENGRNVTPPQAAPTFVTHNVAIGSIARSRAASRRGSVSSVIGGVVSDNMLMTGTISQGSTSHGQEHEQQNPPVLRVDEEDLDGQIDRDNPDCWATEPGFGTRAEHLHQQQSGSFAPSSLSDLEYGNHVHGHDYYLDEEHHADAVGLYGVGVDEDDFYGDQDGDGAMQQQRVEGTDEFATFSLTAVPDGGQQARAMVDHGDASQLKSGGQTQSHPRGGASQPKNPRKKASFRRHGPPYGSSGSGAASSSKSVASDGLNPSERDPHLNYSDYQRPPGAGGAGAPHNGALKSEAMMSDLDAFRAFMANRPQLIPLEPKSNRPQTYKRSLRRMQQRLLQNVATSIRTYKTEVRDQLARILQASELAYDSERNRANDLNKLSSLTRPQLREWRRIKMAGNPKDARFLMPFVK